MKDYITEENIKWLIGITLPIIVTVSGWIYVYNSSQKNMRKDKRITTYISTFNFIREPINEAILSYSKLSTYVFLTSTQLERFSKEDNQFYEADKSNFMKSFNTGEFRILMDKASDNFLKFSASWEQYDVVLQPLVKQRYALQNEFQEVNRIISEVHTEYYTYFYCLNQGMNVADSARVRLITSLKEVHDIILDFFTCIMDVNINLQNFVFQDLIGVSLDKRQVADEKYATIDKLIKKHNV